MKIRNIILLAAPFALSACGDMNSMFGSGDDTNANAYYHHKANATTTTTQTNVVHKSNSGEPVNDEPVSAANNTIHTVKTTSTTVSTDSNNNMTPVVKHGSAVPNTSPVVGQ